MSVSCSDCFSDLLCGEDSTIILSGGGNLSSEYSSDLDSPTAEVEESIAGLLEDERDLAGISSRSTHQPIDSSVRGEFVAWIFKVQRYYGFHPLTAYLSVNYFDRFLHSHHLPKMSGWPLQLLSVACLSIAAKMEEPLVPSLLDLQIDPTGTFTEVLTSRAKDIILSTIQETSFFEYRPSSIAAAAILCAANDLPNFSFITAQHAESWCDGLHKDNIMSCHQLIRQITFSIKPKSQPKVLPQLRVMPRASTIPSASSSSSSSSSSSFSFSLSYKRRKLNNSLWSDDEKGSSD
ncbi:UNVERIFIED_CONTAM: Cyclin-D1-1 [Sesamum angustifolium]|uniref:Cyclin-D1-1 n=1 Tax=Sesamum angustifolium TaxID=2727405 RepID=A0AAW2M7R3_9LAMI